MANYTQAKRPMRVTTPLGTDVLLLESLSGEEAMSVPFELTLDMLSTDAGINPKQLLRQGVGVTLDLADGGQRYLHGRVRRFVQLGRAGALTSYRAEVVPWLWFLSLSSDCKIYQKMSVPDIVKAVFDDHGFSDYRFSFSPASYAKREYCVQYRESHLAFVSRLLEEEGIYYFFEHGEKKHTLVLADAPSAVKSGPVAKLDFAGVEGGNLATKEYVTELEAEHLVCSGKVVLTDYNDEQPTVGLLTTLAGKDSAAKEEVFDYPGGFGKKADGDRLAKLRMEERESMQEMVAGRSNCRALGAGQKLEIASFYRREVNKAYQLLSVRHEAVVGGYRTTDEAGDAFAYDNSFVAIPSTVPYRPPLATPRPVVHGSQTAVVVGKSGEEIWVDKYGRVKVQFFWDRKGTKNEESSCWVRVSSAWAGKSWGFIQLPRVGQEVIVDFLEGNPDRPIITGRVYNADQEVPYALPANGTQSGVKTRSSKGGGTADFNELRFEDKKGSEQVYLHAQKDFATNVENDETHAVLHDRVTTITNKDTKTVKDGDETTTLEKGSQVLAIKTGHQTTTIDKGNQTIKLDNGDQKITVWGNHALTLVNGSQTIKIDNGGQTTKLSMGDQSTELSMGNVTVKASMGKIAYEGMQGIELKVGGNSIKVDQTGITIKGLMVKIEGQVMTEVKGLMTTVKSDAIMTVKGAITMIN
jgi:type VI secretion system secreted protein VgrG